MSRRSAAAAVVTEMVRMRILQLLLMLILLGGAVAGSGARLEGSLVPLDRPVVPKQVTVEGSATRE